MTASFQYINTLCEGNKKEKGKSQTDGTKHQVRSMGIGGKL